METLVIFKHSLLFTVATIVALFSDFLQVLIDNIGIYYIIFFTVLIYVPELINYIKRTKSDRLFLGIRSIVFLALLQGTFKIEFSDWAYIAIVILASGVSTKEVLNKIKHKFNKE